MSDYTTLDEILGKRVEAYAYLDKDELALRFDDGTIIEWWGYHSYPTNPQSSGTLETVKERLGDEWVTVEDP